MTYGDLPEPPVPYSFLYCPHCGASFSATRGDYWADLGVKAVCAGYPGNRHRCVNLRLVHEVRRLVEIDLATLPPSQVAS